MHTCKSHKEPGKVSFRSVHGSHRHAFTGIMSWLSLVLQDALKKWKHLVDSSDRFLDRLKGVRIEHDDVFLHMDLKDLFMTGSGYFLVHHASLLVTENFRAIFRDALTFVLSSQFIVTNLFPGQVWRVQVGSGMGLRCSSHVSNAAFLHAVELCGLSLLSTASKERFGILSYTRYFDNLCFVLKPDFNKIRSLKRLIEEGIGPYKGTLEEASHVGVTFLDVNVVKDDRWRQTGVISYNPYLKPTSLLQVLSTRSMHSSSTHGAWMKAYILRLRKHSSSLSWFRTMKEHVLYRLRKAGTDQAIVTLIDRSSHFTFPVEIPQALQCSVPRPIRNRSIWLKLPFHPVYASCINKGLREFSQEPEHLRILQSFVDPQCTGVRAAWLLCMPTLASVVRRF